MFAGILSVEVFPYGNAYQTEAGDGSWIYECQHGEPECYLNLVHVCVMKVKTTLLPETPVLL